MLKKIGIAILLIIQGSFSQAKNRNEKSLFLKKNESVSKELNNLQKRNKEDVKFLEDIFKKSVNIFLEKKPSHKNHYINYLFKSKLQEIKFNQEQVLALHRLKKDNLKKARRKIKISKKVLEKMDIETLKYYDSKERIVSFLKEIESNNAIKSIKCPLKAKKFYKCYKIDKGVEDKEGEAAGTLILDARQGISLKKIGDDIDVSIKLFSLKSGSGDAINNSELLRMSFFLNGVILETGDF